VDIVTAQPENYLYYQRIPHLGPENEIQLKKFRDFTSIIKKELDRCTMTAPGTEQ
jgi:hypothetical protein